MRRLLVIEIDTKHDQTWSCSKCKYASGNFCELFHETSHDMEDGGGTGRVNKCFESERRFIDASWRHLDLERYEHKCNNKFNKDAC